MSHRNSFHCTAVPGCTKTFICSSSAKRHSRKCQEPNSPTRSRGVSLTNSPSTTSHDLPYEPQGQTPNQWPCMHGCKPLSSKKLLGKHMKNVHGERVSCPECNAKMSLEALTRHRKNSCRTKRSFPCSVCQRSYSRKDDLVQHTKAKHSEYYNSGDARFEHLQPDSPKAGPAHSYNPDQLSELDSVRLGRVHEYVTTVDHRLSPSGREFTRSLPLPSIMLNSPESDLVTPIFRPEEQIVEYQEVSPCAQASRPKLVMSPEDMDRSVRAYVAAKYSHFFGQPNVSQELSRSQLPPRFNHSLSRLTLDSPLPDLLPTLEINTVQGSYLQFNEDTSSYGSQDSATSSPSSARYSTFSDSSLPHFVDYSLSMDALLSQLVQIDWDSVDLTRENALFNFDVDLETLFPNPTQQLFG